MFILIWNLYNKRTLSYVSKRCSWNGSWNRDGKALFLISLWICALSSVVTIRHGTPMSFPVPNFGNCAFALCPLFPIQTDDSNPSPLLASNLQATSVKEQNKDFVDFFPYLSLAALSLSRPLCFLCHGYLLWERRPASRVSLHENTHPHVILPVP